MIAWKIGGDQGEGIDSTGDVLATVANRMGYFVYGYKNFSSRIKGGHTNYKVRISTTRVEATTKRTDILVALNQETIDKNFSELDNGLLLADSVFNPVLPDNAKAQLLTLPLTAIAKDLGSVVMRNMVAVGASAALLQLPVEPFVEYVTAKFERKGQAVVESNRQAVEVGYQRVKEEYGHLLTYHLGEPDPGDRLVINGNDAIALGAIAGGCRLMCGYPITPATDIMESLVKWFPLVGGAVVQMEDELGSITAVIGAGFGGARAMTASSGPGISLMQEAIGLASVAEIPAVIVDTQRGGPSTGMPTKQEQSDLLALLQGGHGDTLRVVLTPGSIEESFEDAVEAFNLAEQFQTPVIIATDLSLSLWQQSVDRSRLNGPAQPIRRGATFSQEDLLALGANVFQRYQFSADGISPRSLPGEAYGQYLATGVEHSTNGKVSEDPSNRTKMMDKRLMKLQGVTQVRDGFKYEGPEDPDLILVGIGSTVGVLKEAAKQLGSKVGVAWFRTLSPFPKERVLSVLASARHVLVVEQNALGQLRQLMTAHETTDHRYDSLLKYNGVPFLPEEVVTRAAALLTPVEVH
ncbi:MAG: 2-oxoacid:acceptor oxidoreductase subunit alpha [Sulfobacillus benefaciens]|uniref:2-oxoacid:acceptor oxidoreductase subunit alpha n=1 Tax=Sulfobacillus benefaciens TaxID=453960 RepID=A0A2T2XGU4_9FIRM|nr:MAG: 2-oxoacid:acceptor oxidoreductase subunit alpha [Sulfobacillus benefaciens]